MNHACKHNNANIYKFASRSQVLLDVSNKSNVSQPDSERLHAPACKHLQGDADACLVHELEPLSNGATPQ